jgi:hypothetical protein
MINLFKTIDYKAFKMITEIGNCRIKGISISDIDICAVGFDGH